MIELRKIVRKIVLLATVLVMVYSYAQAQNTAEMPYLDSKHAYGVNIGLTANTQKWYITKADNSIDIELTGNVKPWAVISSADKNGGFETISLTFNSKDAFDATHGFTTGNWYLRFEETSVATGVCVSRRQIAITIVDNTFWLEISHAETDRLPPATDGIQIYNSQNTLVNTYTAVSVPNLFNSEVKYTVTMHKSTNFQPTYWEFTANFPLGEEVESFSVAVSTTNGGTAATTVGTAGSKYTVKVTPESGYNLDEVKVTLTVQYKHNVLADAVRNLQVNQGSAVQVATVATPQPPNAITIDNVTTYPVATPGDRDQGVTILAIPYTRDIVPGASESVWSAANPLQNSTHKYSVQLGDYANNSANTGTGWHVETDLGVLVANDAANYVLDVTSSTSPNAVGTFTFKMTPGNYRLVFTEVSDNGTSTKRLFYFALGAPFDVALAANTDVCSGASGRIYANVTAENTSVEYKINLTNATYDATWQFNLQLVCDELGGALTAPDPNISITAGSGAAIGAISRAGITITIPVVVTKGAGLVEKNVTVSVNYSGVYATAHTIKATLVAPGTPASFGSFNETDADATNNADEHVINAMPQPLALKGVD